MYSPETALADASSSLTLGNLTYPVEAWPEISSPPYFTAYHGVCSRHLGLGYLGTGEATLHRISAPSALETGQSWVYRTEEGDGLQNEERWDLRTQAGEDWTVGNGPLGVTLVTRKNEVLTRELAYSDDSGQFTLDFDPPLPDCRLTADGTQLSQFSIAIDGHPAQIAGQVEWQKAGSQVAFRLLPQTPAWAAANRMKVELTFSGSQYSQRVETY